MKIHLALGTVAGVLFVTSLLAGCEQKVPPPTTTTTTQPPPPPPVEIPPPEPPRVILFNATNEAVSAAQVASLAGAHAVHGDFNLDSAQDVAMVRKSGDTNVELLLYLGQTTHTQQYFKVGSIRRPLDGKISGFMCSQQGKLINLILLISHGKTNEMVFYQNDGKKFEEISPPNWMRSTK